MNKELISKNFIEWVEGVLADGEVVLDNLDKDVNELAELTTILINNILVNVDKSAHEKTSEALMALIDVIRQAVLLQFINTMSKESDTNE